MNFLRTSALSAVSTGVSFLTGLISTKIVASLVGPTGTALVGQFGNVYNLLLMFSTGACLTGVVKYSAQHKEHEDRKSLLSTALVIVLVSSLVVGLVSILFSSYFSRSALYSAEYQVVYIILGVLLVFVAFNNFFLSVLNGVGEIKQWALLNTVNSVLVMASTIILAYGWGVKGVLVAAVVAAPISFLIAWVLLKKRNLNRFFSTPFSSFRKASVKILLPFSLMYIVSGIVVPVIQLFIRSYLIESNGLVNAGLWQATMRLTDYYLSFVYAVLGVYYIPKLSSLITVQEVKKEIRLSFLRIMPLVMVSTLLIWVCRELIIQWILTEEFRPMLPLLKIQLIGDVVKIAAWLLGYLMVAKAMTKLFIASEIIFSITYMIISYYLAEHYGVIGTIYGFLINYTAYLFFLIIALRKYIF